jgi:uncharacterized protein involved in exopolysaccharide biosynthesis
MTNNNEDVDLYAVIQRLWVKRWWLLGCIAVSTAAFVVAALLITPVYRATTVLAPANTPGGNIGASLNSALGQIGGLASLVGVSGGGEPEKEEALAVLQSREFTDKFIAEKNLTQELFLSKWDPQNNRWRVPEDKQPTPARAYRYFANKIRSVVEDKKTGLVSLRIDWRDRIEAAEWANELVRRLNEAMRSRATAEANASLGYLEKELAVTAEIGTRDAINRLIEAQVKKRMLANVTEEYSFRVLDGAVPPDRDDRYWPPKLLLYVLGPSVGLLIGILCVLLYETFKNKTANHR